MTIFVVDSMKKGEGLVPMQSDIRLRCEETRTLCEMIFMRTGLTEEAARVVTDNLLFADLRGIRTHGITRTSLYVSRARRGYYNVAPKFRVLSETSGTILMDGDNGFGAVNGAEAMRLTIHKAEENGIGLGLVQHSNHYGAASYFSMMAAKKGMIGFTCTNGPANMAPTGSAVGLVGTNPFSIAVPNGDSFPLVLDVATSVVARGKIIDAAKNGESIPVGWAIDDHGKPTTDPNAALLGAVLPFGGHKGSGMAIMIDILSGVLSGAAFGCHVAQTKSKTEKQNISDIGHMFLVMRISALQSEQGFESRIRQMTDELKNASKAQGTEEILLPGEPEARKEAENLRLGIPVSRAIFAELQKLCASMDMRNLLERCIV